MSHRMVRPLLSYLAVSAVLGLALVIPEARAGQERRPCDAGLVLGVRAQDADDLVREVCAAAGTREGAGSVQVNLLPAAKGLTTVAVRTVDRDGTEHVAHTVVSGRADAAK